jgi:tetratricopeptide (TPR) repeat protein
MKFRRRPDLNTLTRVHIAVQAFLAQGVYGEMTRIANCYQVSRLFVYQLLWQLLLLYELEVCGPGEAAASKKEIDRHILLLRLEGKCPLESISQILQHLGLPYASIGYISQRLTAYARALPTEELSGAQILFLLSDEIFTLGQPILITVEPRSLAILKIELVDKREAETWKQHWEQLAEAEVITHPMVVSDQGSGLVKGCQLMGLTHHPDLFHLLQRLSAFAARFYRRALADIACEYERARVFESGKSAPVLGKRIGSYEKARAAARESIDRYDNFCYLWAELRAALELFDRQGKIQELESRKAEIAAILGLLRELGCEKLHSELESFAAGLEGYWGYYERAEKVYQLLIGRYPQTVVQALALGWQSERQATNSKDYRIRKRLEEEAEFYFASAASLLSAEPPQSEAIKREVVEAFDSEVRSSSLIENVNSGLRPLLETCRGQVSQEMLELFAYRHNHRRFVRGKRAGKAPIEILTGKELEQSWIESLVHRAETAAAGGGDEGTSWLGLAEWARRPPSLRLAQGIRPPVVQGVVKATSTKVTCGALECRRLPVAA